MNKTSYIAQRKGAFQSNTSTSSKEKAPITLSEKFAKFEQTFRAEIADVAELKNELKLTKDQLAEAKIEIAAAKQENINFHAKFTRYDEEFKIICAEVRNLKKNIPPNTANDGVYPSGAGSVFAATCQRAVIKKLPCKDVHELKLLIEDMCDMQTLIYLEERLARIGGSDLKSCVTAILDRLRSKELQRDMCLTGKRTTKNGLMEFPQIMDLIHNAVRYSFPNYKDKDGKSIIGKILQK